MKIEVGKTYKDQNGGLWYIETELKRPINSSFPFLATDVVGQQLNVNREGIAPWYAYQLHPNLMKKEGWVAILHPHSGKSNITGYTIFNKAALGPGKYPLDTTLYPSKQAAIDATEHQSQYLGAVYTYARIEWEEEEA